MGYHINNEDLWKNHLNSECSLGANAGSNVVANCGAIVTDVIQGNSVNVRIPAQLIETIDDYYYK